ncbi:MAG: HAD family hydrolase [Promethearchaeota archaeon]
MKEGPYTWIFDLDGTITNHPANFADMIDHAFEKFGVRVDLEPGLSRRIVQTVQEKAAGHESTLGYFKALNYSLKHVAGIGGFFKRLKFILKFSKIFPEHLHLAEMYDGIVETFELLKRRGDQVAILTNGSEWETENTLSRHWHLLEPLVDLVVTRDLAGKIKPDPAGILHIVSELGASPRRTMMVGDSWHDIRAAKNAGVRSVALLCGYGTRESLEREEPEFLLDDVASIPRILDSLA